MNGHPFTVIGVAAPGFHGVEVGSAPDLFLPLAMKAQVTPTWNELENRRFMWLNVLARLKPGMSREQAAAGMQVLYRQINEQELLEMPDAPARFRERFVAKASRGAAGLPRALLPAAAVHDPPARAHGHGGAGASHRLRQRGQPPARPGGLSRARDRDPPGPGRAAWADRPPAPGGEPGPRPARAARPASCLSVVGGRRPLARAALRAGGAHPRAPAPTAGCCSSPSRSRSPPASSSAWCPPGRPPAPGSRAPSRRSREP